MTNVIVLKAGTRYLWCINQTKNFAMKNRINEFESMAPIIRAYSIFEIFVNNGEIYMTSLYDVPEHIREMFEKRLTDEA